MKRLLLCAAASLSLMVPHILLAQNYAYAIGNQPFSTQIPIEGGFINVNNGEIHMEIPLARHTQRGRLQLDETLEYDSRIWKIISNGGYSWQPTNVPNSMGGWRFVSGLETGSVQVYTQIEDIDCYEGNPSGNQPAYSNYFFIWTDPTGVQHWFTAETQQPYSGFCSGSPVNYNLPNTPAATGVAVDGSGYTISVTNYSTATVFDPNGNEVYPTPTDPNGNYFSKDSNGNLIDTLGRTPVLVSQSGNHIYYDVLGYGGARERYTVTTETVNFSTAFHENAVTEASGSFTAIQSIQLPDGSSYSFTYDSGSSGNYGEVTSVTLPSGGTIQYSWLNFEDSFQNENRWIWKRVKDGGTTTFQPNTITVCSGSNGCQEKDTVTSPAGNDTVYTFTLDPATVLNAGSWNTNVDVYQGSSTGGGTKLRSDATSYTYATTTTALGAFQGATGYTETTTLDDVGLASQTQTSLYVFGQPSSVKVWDYYAGSPPSNPTAQTIYGGYCDGVSSQVTVEDGSGNQISQTTTSFDQASLTQTSGLPNHASVSGSRCNVTTVAQKVNSSGTLLNTTSTYDDAGTLLTQTTPNGTTNYGHDSTDTFVTGTQPPTPSSGVSLGTSATYDFSSGLLISATDANGDSTNYKNYDAFGRVGEIDNPDGGKTTFSYTPTQSSVYQYQNASTFADTETQFDGYGRKSRTAVANGQGSNPWYQADTCYDTSGRINFQSYAYQSTGFGIGKVCSGNGDTYAYDALSRVTSVTHGDGTGTSTHYTGRAIEQTDENGVTRISQSDGLGRITSVCEVSANSLEGDSPAACGLDISGTGYLTTYAYNLDSHTTTVQQGAQQRVFQTDWLGRQVLTQEPERGQTTYSYTYNGTGLDVARQRPTANQANPNVLTTTTTQYDSIGRVVSIGYNDGITPNKEFDYDVVNSQMQWAESTANLKGHLADMASGSGSTLTRDLFSYDAMGRVVTMWQCGPSICGTSSQASRPALSFSYDWTGNLTTEYDGASGSILYGRSRAGEVTSVTNQTYQDGYNPADLVSNIQNDPYGPVSWTLGNGLTGVNAYDSLGRRWGSWICNNGSTQNNCGNVSGQGQVYGFAISWKGSQVQSICDTVLNKCESLGYDGFNRLTSLTVTSGQTQNFTYVYDRYGNRWQQNAPQGGPSSSIVFYKPSNSISEAGYYNDAVGNVTNDSFHSYTYDADGNVLNVDGGGTAQYVYDALSRRIGAKTASSDYEYLYDFAGRRISSWIVSDNFGNEGRIYWDGQPLAYRGWNGWTYFEHQDWLSTERIRTDYAGSVGSSYVSMPFGDGFTANVQETYADQDVGHFAALDRDPDSETDHAQFRQYSEALGRWLSPDTYDGSYDFTNPQSFNRYAYVLNDPLSMIDPSGQSAEGTLAGLAGGLLGELDYQLFRALVADILGHQFHGSLEPRPNSQPWDENHIQFYSPDIAGALGLPDAGCEFGACTNPGALSLGPGGPNYQGPPDVAYNGGFLIPLWPLPGLAGVAVGGTAIYLPKQHLFCAGPQVGVEELKQVSAGALFSSAGEMASIAKGWGFNLSAISPWLVGGQVAGALDGKTKPAGGPVAGIPGVSGSISYTWCF